MPTSGLIAPVVINAEGRRLLHGAPTISSPREPFALLDRRGTGQAEIAALAERGSSIVDNVKGAKGTLWTCLTLFGEA
jgi:hypothetical protein